MSPTATARPAASDETFTRRASESAVRSWNEEERTVDVVWAAGAAVRRKSWEDGAYLEVLDMSPSSIRTDRLNTGASLLNAHSAYAMEDRLGTVVPGSVRISGGRAYATVRLSRNPAGEALAQDCRDGHGFAVSCGYRVHAVERIEGEGDALPTIRATDWEPLEISAVPIPADENARTRNLLKGNQYMDSEDLTEAPDTRRSPPSAPAPFGMRQRRELVGQIGRNWTAEERSDFLADHSRANEAQIRSAMLDEIVSRQAANGQFPHSDHSRRSHDNPENFARAAGEALFARANPGHQLSDGARPYAHRSVPELARLTLERNNVRTEGMSASQVIQRALHGTSDFPLLLSGAAEQSLRAGYAVPESELRQAARPTTHDDFRKRFSVDLSSAPQLLKVNEHGEYKRGTLRESREGYGLSTFGRILGFTRQLLINDDLGALVRVPTLLGQSARLFEIKSLVALVEENPAMADGNAVFSAPHGNDLTPAALSVGALSAARLSMRKQVDMNGELIGVAPKFLIVPSELETVAEQVLADLAASTVDAVNPFAKRLTLIVEPRLSSPTAWFVAADPASVPGLEYAHLAGEPGPQIETRNGWDVDGVEIKVRLDFGAAFLDHRGWVRNAGL